MSFILDALKKSENDRQRQSGPALFEVRVAPPRPRFPPWAIAVVALLVVNLAIIGWFMMRKPAVAAPAPQTTAAASPAGVTQSPPQQQVNPPPAQYPAPQPQGYPPQQGYPTQQGYPPQQAGYPQQQPYPPQQGYPPGYAPPGQGAPSQAPYTQTPPPATDQSGTDPRLADYRGGAPESSNPDDYAPAEEASDSGSGPLGGHARRGTESGLPTYGDAASRLGVPPVRLDLHVYAPDPRKRFVLLNMKRLGEGESLPEGVKVESITTEGAILSFRGSKFVMDRD